MQTTFFNSISLSGVALVEATVKNMKQNEVILQVFKEYPNTKFTPFDVMANVKRIYGKDYPITSVRRSITTLTEQGLIVKSERAEGRGIYKVANHRWSLAQKNG